MNSYYYWENTTNNKPVLTVDCMIDSTTTNIERKKEIDIICNE